jgi:EmrB/QacA subfamily drug resistance transporter
VSLKVSNNKQATSLPKEPSSSLSPKVWRALAVVTLGPFMTHMDSTIVNVSLSSIGQDLNTSITTTQWVVSGYLLALAIMLPLNGWLVDRLGAKRLYLLCFSAFTLASVLCGAATTMDELIAARVIQGMAGGLLAPLTQVMMARLAKEHMARALGYASIPALLAPILGPIVAGGILKYAHWPWLFYVNLPIGIFALMLAAFLLPKDEITPQKQPLDLLGFILLSPGLVSLIYGFEHISNTHGCLIFLGGLVLVGVFIWHAHKKKNLALIDMSLFKNRVFSVATVTQFLNNGIMYAGQFLIPLYLIRGYGLTASQAGWMLVAMGLGMLCIYPTVGYLTEKFGFRAVTSGGVFLNFLGTLPFLWMILHEFSPTLTVVCLFVRGLGQGATGIPSLSAAYSSIPKEQLSFATTAMNVVQRLGGPMATTALVIAMSISTEPSSSGPSLFLLPFMVLIGLQLLILSSARHLPSKTPVR